MANAFFACIACVVLAASNAHADPPSITSSNYSLDLFQGPVTTASRIIGLAGAYTALSEWCEGEYSNAAAPAVRAPYSLAKWDDDICLGFTNPGAFAGNDFENGGANFQNLPTRFSNSVTINAGLEVQYGTLGVTAVYDQIRFGLVHSRGHFTRGVDVRLFKFNPWGIFGDDPWRIRLAADLSARYFDYGLSFGKYH